MAQEKFIRTRDSNPGRLASPKKQEFQLLKCFGVISRSDWSIFCFEAEFRLQHGHHDMTFFVSCFSDRLTLVTDFFSKRIVIECDTSMSTTTTTMTTTMTTTTTKMTATRKCRFSDKKNFFVDFSFSSRGCFCSLRRKTDKTKKMFHLLVARWTEW